MAERGVEISHMTILLWVVRYASLRSVVLWGEFATDIPRARLLIINYLQSSKFQLRQGGELRISRSHKSRRLHSFNVALKTFRFPFYGQPTMSTSDDTRTPRAQLPRIR
jgi:hypothetical protein